MKKQIPNNFLSSITGNKSAQGIKLMSALLFVFISVIVNAQVDYFSKAASTDFTDVLSWGTNPDGTGSSPASITNADNYTIQNGSIMNLNAGSASIRKLTINAGSLTIGSNTLTVSIAAQNNATIALNSGSTLTVSGGTLDLLGSLSLIAGGKLIQSAGAINVDGNNAGITATSVAAGVNLIDLVPTLITDVALTGGTLTIVDPHASTTATDVLRFSTAATGTCSGSAGHTFRFGDGVSTDAGGNAVGFKLEPWVSTGMIKFGNIVVNGPTGTNRIVTFGTSFVPMIAAGNVTVNSGGDLRHTGTSTTSGLAVITGNLTVNAGGTFTSLGTFVFGEGAYLTSTTILVTASTIAQVVSGDGIFRNLTASPTANFTSLIINNTNAAGVTFANANSVLSGAVTGTVSGTLTFTAGRVNTATNTFILGISIASAGTLAYTGGGFLSNSPFGRWWSAAGTGTAITAGADPTTVTSRYPFVTASNVGRSAWIERTTPSAGGIITLTYTESLGTTAVAIVDGAYTVNLRTNDSWSVNLGVTAAASYELAIVAPAAFGGPPLLANTRIVQAATVAGTHQIGTITPCGQRVLVAADLTAASHYLGINTSDLPIVTATSGPWEDMSTWAGGVVPTCGVAAAILSGHTVTVSASAVNSGALTINSGGTLIVSGNTLTVGCTNNNTPLTNNGTLNVSGGSLNINGSLVINSGSTFTQSAGTITIDGNDNSGTIGNANSVASGTPIFAIGTSGTAFSTGTVTLSGGTIIIVDPHIGSATSTSAYSIYANMASLVFANASGTHTFQLGDGVSTAAGGHTSGFLIAPFIGSGRLNYRNVTVNSAAGTNRNIVQSGVSVIGGNLTVTLGTFDQGASTTNFGGNISVATGGIFVANGTSIFCSVTGVTTSAQITPQMVSVSGTGAINNLAVSPTANFSSVTINNTSATGVTFNSLNIPTGQPASTSSVSGTLTFTAGLITTGGGNTMILGTSVPAAGTLTVTAGGFSPGSSYGRWSTAAGTGTAITAGVDPTTTTSRYPFVNASGVNRSAWIERVTPSAAGVYAMTYVDAATNSVVSINDGGYIVETRYDGNWTISTLGTSPAAATYKLAILATGAYAASNGNSRITFAATPTAGTHQNGTITPGAQRIGLTLANITSGALYVGIANSDSPFISVGDGPWQTPSTWNKMSVPASTDVVLISSGNTVTVSSTPAVASTLTVTGILNVSGSTLNITAAITGTGVLVTAATGQLNISGGTVTIGTGSDRFSLLTNNGTLAVSSTGTLNINGRLLVNLLSTFNQSGGNINIDGNAAGVSASSVPASTAIVDLNPTLLTSINLTGGTLTIIDPHANATASDVIKLSGSPAGEINVTSGHTIQFGDGVSSDAGGNIVGFQFEPWVSTTGLKFGNVIVNGPTGTNRMLTSTIAFAPLLTFGNLTINSGGEFRQTQTAASSAIGIGGNLVVNSGGTLTTLGITYIGGLDITSSTTFSLTATAGAQSLSNSGTIQNLTAAPTANFTNLQFNNSNATGVTMNSPFSLSGTLTLTSGFINTTTANALTLGTATAAGLLGGVGSSTAFIRGPLLRTFASSRTASGTYDLTTLYPVGKGTSYLPIHIDPTTNVVGPVTMSGEAFTTNSGSMGTGVSTLSSKRWEALVPPGQVSNFVNTFIQLNDASIVASNVILQAGTPAGSYGSILPVISTFAAGSPNTLTTATPIVALDYFGYFSYGNFAPLPVRWLTFDVSKKGSTSVIDWSTSEEINNHGFEILRSLNGQNFEKIGWMDATTQPAAVNIYQFIDPYPKKGSNYYRLMQLDYDGNFDYSPTRKVNFSSNRFNVIISPNPASDYFMIEIQTEEANSEIKLMDMSGKVVMSQKVQSDNVKSRLQIDHLSPGTYTIVVESGSDRFTEPVVIIR